MLVDECPTLLSAYFNYFSHQETLSNVLQRATETKDARSNGQFITYLENLEAGSSQQCPSSSAGPC